MWRVDGWIMPAGITADESQSEYGQIIWGVIVLGAPEGVARHRIARSCAFEGDHAG